MEDISIKSAVELTNYEIMEQIFKKNFRDL